EEQTASTPRSTSSPTTSAPSTPTPARRCRRFRVTHCQTGRVAEPRATRFRRPRRRRAASDQGRSRVGDATSPIVNELRLARGRNTTIALGLAAVLIAGALGAALFAIPIQNYFAQDEKLAQRASQLERLEAVNADLAAEVARLRTAAGVREAAREELGMVEQ